MSVLVVPLISNPLSAQPIMYSKETYKYLCRLELADTSKVWYDLKIDFHIGVTIIGN